MAHEFVGAGWAFPLAVDQTGAFQLVTDEREVEQAIRLILGLVLARIDTPDEEGTVRPAAAHEAGVDARSSYFA